MEFIYEPLKATRKHPETDPQEQASHTKGRKESAQAHTELKRLSNENAILKRAYETLRKDHDGLQNELCGITKRLHETRDLLEEQDVLKRSANLRLEHAEHELVILTRAKDGELHARDNHIKVLEAIIKLKELDLIFMRQRVQETELPVGRRTLKRRRLKRL